jgi:hypothetical protein
VPIAAVFDGAPAKVVQGCSERPGDPARDVVLYCLDLGKDTSGNLRGIRDLVASTDGFIVIAGPVNDPAEGTGVRTGDYSLVWTKGSAIVGRADLPGFGPEVKPEAVVPLGDTGVGSRVLLLFDGPTDGHPTPFMPTRLQR